MTPEFPPLDINEWFPAKPPSPPIPKWLAHRLGLNPWLTTEERSELEAEFGDWAAHRAEALVPKSFGLDAVRRSAYNMLMPYISQLPQLPAEIVTPATERKRRERKPRIPSIRKEVEGLEKALRPTNLTPEQEEKLTDATLELVIDYRKRHKGAAPTTEWKKEQALAVVAWADDDYKVKISEEKGLEIVNKALVMFAPERA